MRLFVLALSLTISSVALANLTMGELPPSIKLSGELGGRVDGTDWSSEELKNKVYYVAYVDPDEKDLNEHVGDALKAENLPRDKFQSVAIINMAATWKPNFAINSALKSKQEKFPNTIYVKDFNKALVQSWKFSDDNYCIALFDHQGKLIWRKDGKVSKEELATLIETIKTSIAKVGQAS